jgi:hypothetical protein
MADGIQLTLMIGPVDPAPVSRDVLDALQSVELTLPTTGPGLFQLVFTLSTRSPLHTLFLLTGGSAIPLMRVIIAVTVGGQREVLIDGVMTHHQVTPGGYSGAATLTVTGEDLTRVMDYIAFDGFPFPAMPPEARVLMILAKYAMFGVAPIVVPSIMVDVPIPVKSIPRQVGTDLAYVRKLADDVGYVFYVEAGPVPGKNKAYWGPLVKVGKPQPALNVDMDAHTNVEGLNFAYDSEKRQLPVLFIQDEITKIPIPIPIPDFTPLNPPLGLIGPIPKCIRPIPETAKLSPVRAVLLGLARAAQSADAVSATGTLDVVRYGRVLKPRCLVGARGVGPAIDGLYYVDSVTHHIRRGEYKQSFKLTRNGLLSTVPRVSP